MQLIVSGHGSSVLRCVVIAYPALISKFQGLHLSLFRNRCSPRSAGMLMIMKGPRHHSLLAAHAESHLFSSGSQTQGDTPVLDVPPDWLSSAFVVGRVTELRGLYTVPARTRYVVGSEGGAACPSGRGETGKLQVF
jgi:hypothetical protein